MPRRDLPSFEVQMEVLLRGGAELDEETRKRHRPMELLRQNERLIGVRRVPPEEPRPEGQWLEFLNTDFDRIDLRFDQEEDGRVVVTGILVTDRTEIGSSDLRTVQLADLVSRFESVPSADPESLGDPFDTVRIYREALKHHPYKPIQWTADHLGVDQATVHRRLIKAGVKTPKPQRSRKTTRSKKK
jgi:hypothetical protein